MRPGDPFLATAGIVMIVWMFGFIVVALDFLMKSWFGCLVILGCSILMGRVLLDSPQLISQSKTFDHSEMKSKDE
jgi:hypothetical protein